MTTTTPPTEIIYQALAAVYTMLVKYRGFTTYADTHLALGKAELIRMLPLDKNYYRSAIDRIFMLNLLHRDSVKEFTSLVDERWLCAHVRPFLFITPQEIGRSHAGITYSLVLVVVTTSDTEAAAPKLKHAYRQLHNMYDQLKLKKLPVTKARILRLVYGPAPTNPTPIVVADSLVSTETWYTAEIQTDITKNFLVPSHQAFDGMTQDELNKLPEYIRKAITGSHADPNKLDIIYDHDIIARWYGFVAGQHIVIKRRVLMEGGESYTIRVVRE